MLTLVFSSLGRRVARHPRLSVLVWLVLTALGIAMALFGVHGEGLFDRVTTGAPAIPGSGSQKADQILADGSEGGPEITLLVQGADPADADVAAAMEDVNATVAGIEGVESVINAYVLPDGVEDPAAGPLVAQDGDGFLTVVTLRPDLESDESTAVAERVVEELTAVPDQLASAAPEAAADATGLVGSNTLIVDAITDQVEQDLRTGEVIALPIALLVMILVFGGFLAAAMPMAGALASIGVGLGALLGLTYLLDVDASIVNVVTVLGLGLSIDYGLLIVSRFREELHRLLDSGENPTLRRRRGDGVVQEALVRTMGTAGRTVAYSAVTVAVSIASLLVFRPDILRSVGAGGLAIVLVAVATALTLVPALLVMSGRRLARPGLLGRVPGVRRVLASTADVESDEGAFSRLATRVQRRPWWVLLGTVVALGVLALPLAGLQMRNSGIELLPTDAPQREFVDELAAQYPSSAGPQVIVVAEATPEDAQAWADADVASLDDVTRVDLATTTGTASVIGVHVADADAGGEQAVSVVRQIRDLDAGFDVYVTGQAAGQVDFVDALAERVWWAVAIVVVAAFVLLFLMTGSVVVPVQALVTNALSLAAALGVLVWVFQDGHLESLLDFTAVGGIETYVIALVVAFAFGLAMDYEVFLLARVKELVDDGRPNDEAIRVGLQRSGRIITSAAAIIVVVFAGFVFGDMLVIKEVGFALAIAVVIDATLVRMLLVPATMTVLGRATWWAPRPLRRLHSKVSLTH
ncbi:MMPL family transporter [Cellulosimicrobium arenosum]|uniref:MMPL family transporter n=1 Tax=Cellulosimicrobium arenosum TaxID=2708133 RepID=A0A927IYS4_9MICO|nr:MMPL family transporter [Cellulosimicrobium arenosum]MBD8077890.1 MMPL family transporter [Cellulosimicrobium arenosum]